MHFHFYNLLHWPSQLWWRLQHRWMVSFIMPSTQRQHPCTFSRSFRALQKPAHGRWGKYLEGRIVNKWATHENWCAFVLDRIFQSLFFFSTTLFQMHIAHFETKPLCHVCCIFSFWSLDSENTFLSQDADCVESRVLRVKEWNLHMFHIDPFNSNTILLPGSWKSTFIWLPSRGRSHIPHLGIGKSSTQNAIFGGYVNSENFHIPLKHISDMLNKNTQTGIGKSSHLEAIFFASEKSFCFILRQFRCRCPQVLQRIPTGETSDEVVFFGG